MSPNGTIERRTALAAAILLILAAAAAPGAARAAAGEPPQVVNGAAPADGVRDVTLREQWRAGGDDDEYFFGSVQAVKAGPGGDVYVMDSQLSEVHVYSPEGEHLRILGHEGEGPGEVRGPNDIFFPGDGTLAIAQGYPGKVVKVTLAGEPAGTMSMGSGQGQFGVLVRTLSRGGVTVFVGMRMGFTGAGLMSQDMFVSSCDTAGGELHRFLSKSFPVDFNNFVMTETGLDFVWSGRIALDDRGRLYLGEDRDAYRVKVYDPDGALVRVFEKPYEPWRRDQALKDNQQRSLEAVARNYPGAVLQGTTVEENEPAIAAMTVDDAGRIWILPSRGVFERPEGVLAGFDVFDADGRYRERVNLHAPGDPARDFVFLLPDRRVVVVQGGMDAYYAMQGVGGGEGEEAPSLEVVCYRMED